MVGDIPSLGQVFSRREKVHEPNRDDKTGYDSKAVLRGGGYSQSR